MLDLRDLSVGGLSAIADIPLNRGELLGVFVSGHGIKSLTLPVRASPIRMPIK